MTPTIESLATDSPIDNPPIPAWYKQFWPWFLIFFPASAVIAGTITIIIAINHHDSAVVDDYYKKGLAINRLIEQQELAASMGLTASAEYVSSTGEITLVLDARSDSNLAVASLDNVESLSLSFIHTTLAEHDRNVLLHKDQRGFFKTVIKDIQAGSWNLVLEPAGKQWRLDARMELPAASWVLKPNI